MCCPALDKLPQPPPGKTDWPWIEESAPLPPTRPDGSAWPRISIVTPSYNQGPFLEETIRSVLLQGYPNLEYIVIDGGSSDESVSVIRKYEPWLNYWVTEKDQGQADAINKGWQQATGSIRAWLNSDDLYCPDTLGRVARTFYDHPQAQWLCGSSQYLERGIATVLIPARVNSLSSWLTHFLSPAEYSFPQPSVFLRQELLTKIGGLDRTLQFCFDFDYWCRIRLAGIEPLVIDPVLSFFRLHSLSKTCSKAADFFREDLRVAQKLGPRLPRLQRWKVAYHASRASAHLELWSKIGLKPWRKAVEELFALLWNRPVLATSRQYWGAVRLAFRSGSA